MIIITLLRGSQLLLTGQNIMVIKRNGTFLGRMQVNGPDQKCSMKDGTDQIIGGFYKEDEQTLSACEMVI